MLRNNVPRLDLISSEDVLKALREVYSHDEQIFFEYLELIHLGEPESVHSQNENKNIFKINDLIRS